VMSVSGAELLKRVHGIPDDQIDLIPQGIPHVTGDPRAAGGRQTAPDCNESLANCVLSRTDRPHSPCQTQRGGNRGVGTTQEGCRRGHRHSRQDPLDEQAEFRPGGTS
jgi:hypothetical protein